MDFVHRFTYVFIILCGVNQALSIIHASNKHEYKQQKGIKNHSQKITFCDFNIHFIILVN